MSQPLPPPEIQITREGMSNFEEIRQWASANLATWKIVERWRMIHHWTDTEFLEVLASQLALTLHEHQRLAGLGQSHPVDPTPPPLFQEVCQKPWWLPGFLWKWLPGKM